MGNYINKPYIYALQYNGKIAYIGLHNGKDKYYFSGGVIPNKLGKDKFIKGVIEYCTNDELINKEIYYIKKYKPFFNLTTGGEQTSNGTKHSKDVINRRKKSFMKNKHHLKTISDRFKKQNKENNPCIKHKIKCLNDGLIHNSIRQASRYYNIDNSYISKHIKGLYSNVKGYRFERV